MPTWVVQWNGGLGFLTDRPELGRKVAVSRRSHSAQHLTPSG
jgi:hypothetical protein